MVPAPFTAPVVIALMGLIIVFLVHTVVVARWTARIQAMVEKHDDEIINLRKAKHDVATKVFALDTRLTGAERDIQHIGRRAT